MSRIFFKIHSLWIWKFGHKIFPMKNSTFQRQILFLLASTLILTCDSLSFCKHVFISRWQQQNSQDKGRLRHSCLLSLKQVCAPPGIRLQRQKMSSQLFWKTKEVAHPKHLYIYRYISVYIHIYLYITILCIFFSTVLAPETLQDIQLAESTERFPWGPQLTIHMQTLFIWPSPRLSDCG